MNDSIDQLWTDHLIGVQLVQMSGPFDSSVFVELSMTIKDMSPGPSWG